MSTQGVRRRRTEGQEKPADAVIVKPQKEVAAVKQMGAELREVYTQISTKIGALDRQTLLTSHWLGGKIASICAKPEIYGENAVELIAEALGRDESMIYKTRQFFEVFTVDEVKQALATAEAQGHPLTISHFFTLMSVSDSKARKALLDRTIKQRLTVVGTQDLVKNSRGGAAGSGGRPMSKPATPTAGLREIVKMSSGWLKRRNLVWSPEGELSILDQVDNAISTTTGEDLKAYQMILQELNDNVEAMQQTLQEDRDKIVELTRKLEEATTNASTTEEDAED